MRKIGRSIIGSLSLTLVLFYSCSSEKVEDVKVDVKTNYDKLQKLDWLVGKWENKTPEGYAAEIWEKENDSTFNGVSYFIAGKDTVSFEKISLLQSGLDLFYVPTVKGQNSGQPVTFQMTSQTDDLLVFENPEHDFPQKITYTRITNDSLLAEISGMIEGKPSTQQFPLVRSR
ncbi:MAG: DUF6265 family protein [Bacteroidota bacterium]